MKKVNPPFFRDTLYKLDFAFQSNKSKSKNKNKQNPHLILFEGKNLTWTGFVEGDRKRVDQEPTRYQQVQKWYQNQEVENSPNQVPYQDPGTEPGSSGLNFLGGPRSNWFNRDVTGFLQEITVCFFYQDNRLIYVFLDVHLNLHLKNHIDVFLDVLNIVLDVVHGIDIDVDLEVDIDEQLCVSVKILHFSVQCFFFRFQKRS